MPRISEAPEGGKFRARASAALGGTIGAWGDGDLLCVTFDTSGDLVVGAAATTRGVIWVPEGRKDSTKANYKTVIAAKMYTVFTWAVVQEMEDATAPTMDLGDALYAAAAGDVTVTTGGVAGAGAGAVYIGQILNDETVKGGTGRKLILNVNGFLVGTA